MSFVYLYNYLLYLFASVAMIAVFALVYTKITPYDEITLIKQGQLAAAFSFCGALLGFSLTLASSILHSDNFFAFAGWSGAAMAVQLVAYAGVAYLIPNIHQQLEQDNQAVGALLGGVSLTLGIINAACLS